QAALAVPALRVVQIALRIGRAEDVAGALQADAGAQLGLIDQGEPGLVGQGDQALFDELEVALDLLLVAADAEAEGVLQHDGQQLGGGLAAQDRAFEAGGQQPGDAADVVDVHVGGDQGANAVEGEVDGQVVGAGPAFDGGFRALEQAAVDQQAVLVVHVELVAGASD